MAGSSTDDERGRSCEAKDLEVSSSSRDETEAALTKQRLRGFMPVSAPSLDRVEGATIHPRKEESRGTTSLRREGLPARQHRFPVRDDTSEARIITALFLEDPVRRCLVALERKAVL